MSKKNPNELIWKHFKSRIANQPQTHTTRNAIALQHQNIVRGIAHDIAGNCAVEYEDLEQIGMIGLLKAVEKFDPTKGISFSSFATPYVRGEILHHLRDSGSNVKVPRRMREMNSTAKRVERRWVVAHDAAPTEQELAKEMNVTVERLQRARAAIANQHAIGLIDDIQEIPQPESYALSVDQHQQLEQTWAKLRANLSKLPDSERELLRAVFVQRATQKALAKTFKMDETAISNKLGRVLTRIAL